MSGIVAKYKVECEESKSLKRKESWPFETAFDTDLNKISDNCGRKKSYSQY